jgi:hypothetical protein
MHPTVFVGTCYESKTREDAQSRRNSKPLHPTGRIGTTTQPRVKLFGIFSPGFLGFLQFLQELPE